MVKIMHKDISPGALKWFEEICQQVKKDTGIEVLIYTTDYRKDGHALGRIYGWKQGEGIDPAYITVDTFTVQECYNNEIGGCGYTIHGDTLKGILCHELAHIKYYRHGAKHRQQTQWLLDLCS